MLDRRTSLEASGSGFNPIYRAPVPINHFSTSTNIGMIYPVSSRTSNTSMDYHVPNENKMIQDLPTKQIN